MTPASFAAWWGDQNIPVWKDVDPKLVAEAAWTARGEALRPWLRHKPSCRTQGDHSMCDICETGNKHDCSCGLDAATERRVG